MRYRCPAVLEATVRGLREYPEMPVIAWGPWPIRASGVARYALALSGSDHFSVEVIGCD